jgi:hypothetical protein
MPTERRAPRRRPRAFALLALAALLAPALTGCVTVHGERALVPAAPGSGARAALARFVRINNAASKAYDAKLIDEVETGPLGAVDHAGLTVRHREHPQGATDFTPLKLRHARFLVPRLRGWPRWFAVEAESNRAGARHWLLVFQRGAYAGGGRNAVWRASYIAVLTPGELPKLARDSAGHVEAVPAGADGLAVKPGQLAAAYAAYLQDGPKAAAPVAFAAGPDTTGERAARAGKARTADSVTQFADQAAPAAADPPMALRTADGGALVFFATLDQTRITLRSGTKASVDQDTRELMTGTLTSALTLSRESGQVAVVPAAGKGAVRVLDRNLGLVAAKAE